MTDALSLLAYIGPDQMLPVASAFAAILGVLLMFWRFFVHLVTKPFKVVFHRNGGDATAATAENDPAAVVERRQNA